MTEQQATAGNRHGHRKPLPRLAVLGLLLGLCAGLVSGNTAIPPRVEAAAEPASLSPLAPAPASDPVPPPVLQVAPEPVVRLADPVRIVIPRIDVDEKIVPVGLNPDKSMAVPDFGLTGWYTKGPKPGEPGPAVIAGHVDSRSGPDVFFRLRELGRGDEIRVVKADGEVEVFTVRGTENQPKDELPVERIWNQTDEPVLRLITCGGEFDYSTRHYVENTIVYARRAD